MEKDFSIVFEKLHEAAAEQEAAAQQENFKVHATEAEVDEIAELRRLVLEITEPEPLSFTITWLAGGRICPRFSVVRSMCPGSRSVPPRRV